MPYLGAAKRANLRQLRRDDPPLLFGELARMSTRSRWQRFIAWLFRKGA